MRTKALLGAAIAAVCALPAMAQVYSLNVVGYINLPMKEGLNLVANQLDVDGTGTNNKVYSTFGTNLPYGSQVYTWNPASATYLISTYSSKTKKWDANATNNNLNPGQGAWISIPAGAYGGTTQQVALVGNVLQGALVNPNMAPNGGLSLLSVMFPVAGDLQTNFNYTPFRGDTVYKWVNGAYDIANFSAKSATWNKRPTINVGDGFWLNSTNKATVWSNYFIVQ